jgi:predicted PurR-regulated permease PerM
MKSSILIPNVFFFIILLLSLYSVWLLFSPFFTAIAIAVVMVVVAYPLYSLVYKYVTRGRAGLAAGLSTLLVFSLVVAPVFYISNLLITEFFGLYQSLEKNSAEAVPLLLQIENVVASVVPGMNVDFTEPLKQVAAFVTRSLGSIFSSVVSIILTILISIIATFFLFRDGQRLLQWLISLSPLSDRDDTLILSRIGVAIRTTIIGTIVLSIVQGIVATTGFAIFGIERAVLWGSLGAFGALIPGVGLVGIMLPAVAYLYLVGNTFGFIGLAVWAVIAVIVVDNILGPYLMSRGSSLHPLLVLLSVLGGISLLGPIGFIIGPVLLTIFLALLDIYRVSFSSESKYSNIK